MTSPLRAGSSYPQFLGDVKGIAIFAAGAEYYDADIWRTDGTAEGSFPLVQGRAIYDYALWSSLATPDALYFSVAGEDGWRIWKTDGSVAGTIPLTAPDDSEGQWILGAFDGKVLYFKSRYVRELWVVDSSGDHLVESLDTGHLHGFTTWKDHAYIWSDHGLWRSDGTVEGTTRIFSGSAWTVEPSKGLLFFFGYTPENGMELWTADPFGRTFMVKDLYPGPTSSFSINSSVGFLGDRAIFISSRGDIGVSDGTDTGTHILHNGVPPPFPVGFARLGDSLYFFYHDDLERPMELWRSDGTEAGTHPVSDENDPQFVYYLNPVAGATRIYFYGSDRDHRMALFESNGAEGGTRVVKDLSACGVFEFSSLMAVGDTVFFNGTDCERGEEPWISDGTEAGTHLIVNVSPEPAPPRRPIVGH